MHSFPSEKVKLVKHVKIYHPFISAFKAKANHRFSCIQTCIHSKIINLKMVSWSSDTRSSKKLSPDPKVLICWPPAEARSHLFWHLIPCRSKKQGHHYLNLLICWSSANARSHLFWHWIPYRSKILAFIYFFDSLQKQSHHYLNSLICWSSANARSRLFWH